MNIGMASDSYWPRVNGATVSIETFRGELIRRGHSVPLLVPDFPGGPGLGPQDDSNVHRLHSRVFFASPEDRLITGFKGCRRGVKLLKDRKPEILHAQTEFAAFQLLLTCKKKFDIPLILTCHTYWEQYINHYLPWMPGGTGRWTARKILSNCLNQADLIISPSMQMKRVLESYGLSKEIRVIPTGVDAELFKGAARKGIDNLLCQKDPELLRRKIVLYAGRISKEKNLELLLEAAGGLKAMHRNLLVLLVGDGPSKEELSTLVKRRGWDDFIRFIGYVPRNELKIYYHLADVFVFPSLTETQGLVTLEAMLCGTPVVAVGAMGTLEVMGGDNGGYMVSSSHAEIISAVDRLLTDPRVWKEKSLQAEHHASRWTVSALTDRLLEAYGLASTAHHQKKSAKQQEALNFNKPIF